MSIAHYTEVSHKRHSVLWSAYCKGGDSSVHADVVVFIFMLLFNMKYLSCHVFLFFTVFKEEHITVSHFTFIVCKRMLFCDAEKTQRFIECLERGYFLLLILTC